MMTTPPPAALGPEPEGYLCRKHEIFAWLPWLTDWQWRQIQPTLSTYVPPGGSRPLYRREEIRAALVMPALGAPRPSTFLTEHHHSPQPTYHTAS